MGGELPGRTGERPLRIGVIGAGFIGAVHAHAARRAGARVVGVAASSAASTDEAVRRLGAERGFTDADELIASPEVDVVHVCTPNHLHAPQVDAAVAAHKHVVCEKPLAVDGATAARLEAAADAAGVVATVPFVYRFYPMVREARVRVRGWSGGLTLVHGSYLQDWLSTSADDNWRVDAAYAGASRAFADIGSHWCDLVEFVTGDRLVAVCAELVTAVGERVHREHAHAFETASRDERAGDGATAARRAVSTEDVAIVMFRTASGVTGSVVISQISPGHKNQLRFEVAGADTTVAFDQEQPETLWLGGRNQTTLLSRDPGQLDAAAAAYVTVPPGHPQGYQDCFDAFVADSYRAIAAGSAAGVAGLPTFADGARAARITDAVLRSAGAHAWVDVEPDPAPDTDPTSRTASSSAASSDDGPNHRTEEMPS